MSAGDIISASRNGNWSTILPYKFPSNQCQKLLEGFMSRVNRLSLSLTETLCSRAADGGSRFRRRTVWLRQLADLPKHGKLNSRIHPCAEEHSSETEFKRPSRGCACTVDSGSFRQRVVHSCDAVYRPLARPRVACPIFCTSSRVSVAQWAL
jgi:hypothetical protein